MHSSLPSPAFVHREANGEELLSELNELREAQVTQRQLVDFVGRLKALKSHSFGGAVPEIQSSLRAVSSDAPRLAAIALRWLNRLRVDRDVPLFVEHFERLMFSSVILSVIRNAGARLDGAARDG